jgi:hypothetical protein
MNLLATVTLGVAYIVVSLFVTMWIASIFHVEDMTPEEEEAFWQAWMSYECNYSWYY